MIKLQSDMKIFWPVFIYQNMPDWQTGTDAKKHISTESNAHLLWVDTDGM